MELQPNKFKRAIQSGKLQIGLWSSLSSHVTVEVIAGAGFDWILLVRNLPKFCKRLPQVERVWRRVRGCNVSIMEHQSQARVRSTTNSRVFTPRLVFLDLPRVRTSRCRIAD